MKKNTKKKLLSVMLIIALLAIAVVGGSLAWFTAEDEVTNTFTVGSIKIEQNETDKEGNPFVQDQFMLPIVNTITPSDDKNYIEKVVTLTNNGKNEAYVRTHIAYPAALSSYIVLDTNNNSPWQFETYYTVTIDGVVYGVSTFVYTDSFVSEKETEPLLYGVYMNANVDVKVDPANEELGPQFCKYNDTTDAYEFSEFPYTNTVSVRVLTQAVQVDGFADRETALSSAFGILDSDHNPFIN